MNERLLRDTCEARMRVVGHPGPPSSPGVEPSIRFALEPSSPTWYRAHNITIVTAYLDRLRLGPPRPATLVAARERRRSARPPGGSSSA